MNSLKRTFNAIYSYSDEKTEDYIKKEYMGLLRLSFILLKVDGKHAVFSLILLAIYVSVLIFHCIVGMKSCFPLIHINLVLFVQNIHFFLLIQLVLIIIAHVQFKRREILNLHKAVSFNFYNYFEHYIGNVDKLRREMFRERKIFVAIPILVCLATACVLCVAPIADQYGSFDFNKTMHLNINYDLPFPFVDYPYSTHDSFGYYMTVALQLFHGLLASATVGTLGFMYIVLSQNIFLQMKILLDSLANIEERTIIMLATEFGLNLKLSEPKLFARREFAFCYKLCLKKNIKHHQVIKRNFHEWSSLFSGPVFIGYMTGTIAIALSLLSAGSWSELPGTTVSSLVLCGGEVGYMYIISTFSQRVRDLNEDLRFQMYSIKWYHCNEGVKRTLRIFQEVTKRPMTLVAGDVIPANMDTFAKVMNSAYSYYNLANAFKAK